MAEVDGLKKANKHLQQFAGSLQAREQELANDLREASAREEDLRKALSVERSNHSSAKVPQPLNEKMFSRHWPRRKRPETIFRQSAPWRKCTFHSLRYFLFFVLFFQLELEKAQRNLTETRRELEKWRRSVQAPSDIGLDALDVSCDFCL